jgi:phage terminase large subunit-like protein
MPFDKDLADRAEWILRSVVHTKGRWRGHPFQPLDYQVKSTREAFGRVNKDGTRQYRRWLEFVPKKNGKTERAGALANHLAFCDNEPGAEVYFAAADLDQAARAFDVATTMIRHEPELDSRCRVLDSQKKVTIPETGSYLKVLSSEHRGKHGANIHGLVFDEMHAQPDRKLYDTLTFGTGRARRQPLHFFPSTAGDDMDSICYQLWQEARDIRDGVIDDPTTLVVLYEAPDDADIESPDVWAACNPALGAIFTEDDMRAELAQAKRSVADEMLFRQLSLNQWVTSAAKWFRPGVWGACTDVEYGDRRAARKAVDKLERELRGQPCVAGLDLGSVSDTTAFVLLFRDGNRVRCIVRYWMSEGSVKQHALHNRKKYRHWVRDGWIKATEGDVVDYGVIREDIKALGEMYGIQRICFDKAFAGQLAQDLEGAGYEMASISQGYSGMNAASQEFETYVIDRRFDHGGHPVLWSQANDVAIKPDTGNQIRPLKPPRGASVTIDGIVAAVMALGGLITLKVQGPSVYETRGVITL